MHSWARAWSVLKMQPVWHNCLRRETPRPCAAAAARFRCWPLALSKISRTLASDSPNHMVSSSGPLTEMKLAWHSLAIALASSVLPQPGGKAEREGRRVGQRLESRHCGGMGFWHCQTWQPGCGARTDSPHTQATRPRAPAPTDRAVRRRARPWTAPCRTSQTSRGAPPGTAGGGVGGWVGEQGVR